MPGDVVYQATLGSLTLRQVTSGSYASNARPIAGTASGSLDVAQYYGGPGQPSAAFESEDIGSVMAISNVLTAGIPVASGTITIPFQKRAVGATFQSGSNHETVSGTDGLIIPTSISCQQDGNATVSLQCAFSSPSGAEPATVNANQSLSAETFQGLFGLGPGSINSNAISELVGVTINPGITIKADSENGLLYPTRIYIIERRPTIDFTFRDFADVAANFGSVFTVGTAAIAYLRARSGTGYASNASEAHLKFSFADGIVATEQLAASGTESGTVTMRVYGESLTVAVDSAIT